MTDTFKCEHEDYTEYVKAWHSEQAAEMFAESLYYRSATEIVDMSGGVGYINDIRVTEVLAPEKPFEGAITETFDVVVEYEVSFRIK